MQVKSIFRHNNTFIHLSDVVEGKKIIDIIDNTDFEGFFEKANQHIFVSEKKINNLRYINRHFNEINRNLEFGDAFFGYFETFSARKNRFKISKFPILRNIFFFFDFLINRVMPKILFLHLIYFKITKGQNRVLSKAEVLGRLICNGFEIQKVENINNLCYFIANKVAENDIKKSSSYGLIFKMPRIGKNGKLFNVYKFRTMHPFSEYLQDYMLEKFGFAESGKYQDDFRLTPWGRIMRKYWIDELPQLFNVLKGDMKLVGVRPVSRSYFKILPEDLKIKRIKNKPGCIPPYVSLNAKSSVEEVLNAERTYLEKKILKPYTTDLKFFFYAAINILFKGKRSS